MKQTITPTLLALALTIASCGGGSTTQNNSGAPSADTSATAKAPEKPVLPNPYDVDNLSGKYVDWSRPILITTQSGYDEESGPIESVCEYCRYDALGRILEYGCLTGQFDYEGYIRMFKIHYNGDKIDSIQCKELHSELVDNKSGDIFKKGVSIFDIVNDEYGGLYPTDTAVKDLDPYSIASMRQYAETKDDILWRQFGFMYDFSGIQKWDKEQRDNQSRLTYSEYTNKFGDGGEYEHYKINYTYGDDFVKRNVHKKQRVEFEGEMMTDEWDNIQIEKYLHTDTQPAAPQQSSTVATDDSGNGQKVFGDINQDGNQDCITYTDQDLQVSIAGTSFNKKYIVEDEYSDRNITEITINQKGVIKILTTWTNSRGADGDDNYTVRFQDGDLYLIGYDNYYKPATNESYNLLTLKKETTSGMTDDDTKKTTTSLKKIPLHRLSEIKIGEYCCEDYEE